MASKRPAKKSEPSTTPLDEKRKALYAHEQRLNEQIAKRQQLIENAPRLKQEQARQRRDEILKKKSRNETGTNARAALHDKRHVFDATTAAMRPGPRLKREQRRGMLTFFVLLAAFACVLVWSYFTLFRRF